MKKLTALALILAPATVLADGVGVILTTKSIPPSTVAVIDPETGTSQGGAGSDVKYAVGDIISFRFRYFPIPDQSGALDGMQGYLTEYIPANTEVVGVRILDKDNNNPIVLTPRWPGIEVDFNTGGSITEAYADTGIFVTSDARLLRSPLDSFLQMNNGLGIDEPRQATQIADILDANGGDIRAHNLWDRNQVNYFGDRDVIAGQGSPVAGSGAFYNSTRNGSGTDGSCSETCGSGFETGPWVRVKYPRSLVGTELPNFGNQDYLRRTSVGASTSGVDLTSNPTNPANDGLKAVRIAIGDIRVGRPGVVEVSLRVTGSPLEPSMATAAKDTDCAEIFGGDSSRRSPNVTPSQGDQPWATFLPTPACVFLNLLFDLRVNNNLGIAPVLWTLTGQNLSLNTQQNVVVWVGFLDSDGDVDVTKVTPPPDGNTTFACPAAIGVSGLTCLRWTKGSLPPSAKYTHTIPWTVGGGGKVSNIFRALYTSNDPNTPANPDVSYVTQELILTQPTPVFDVSFTQPASVSAGSPRTVSGTLLDRGSAVGGVERVGVFVPGGWKVDDINIGGGGAECTTERTQDPNIPGTSIDCIVSFDIPINNTGVSMTFIVTPPAGTPTGLYPVHVNLWSKTAGAGGQAENMFDNVVQVPVGADRTAKPTVTCPNADLKSSITTISGTAEPNATIRIYFDGILRCGPETGCTVTADGSGNWSYTGFTSTFGPLYGGVQIRATAQLSGQLESVLSDPCNVSPAQKACNDEKDNDGDGRIDFPDDPGCTSLGDDDETNPGNMQCSNTVDDADPEDQIADWPNDPGCFGPTDLDETDMTDSSAPACDDGIDNDSDGKKDFPADPGCHSLNDNDETDPAQSTADFPPRILFVVDTSGSMNFDVCAESGPHFAGGDGSAECFGSHASAGCAASTAGNGTDSRIYKVKAGMSDVIAGFGEVEYGMMRFFQRAVTPFTCPVAFPAVSQSGAWQGAGGIGSDALGTRECPGFDAGELLVGFSKDDNRYDMLEWLDNKTNYPGPNDMGPAPPKRDFELRGSGTTPLGGSLATARGYLGEFIDHDNVADDPKASCRPYRVILLTDGKDTCGGSPATEASLLKSTLRDPNNPASGILTNVIGFGTLDPNTVQQLNSIAIAGGTGPQAILVDDSAELSAAISGILSDSILVEKCNGKDDDCDDLVDEGFPTGSCNNGLLGRCALSGTIQCTGDFTTGCVLAPCALQGGCGPLTETCNQIDDDCDGMVDEGLSCPNCLDEVCNGFDDDCDGTADDGNMPGVGTPCGVDVPNSACVLGHVECRGTMGLQCIGAIGPTAERCNGIDDDCDGNIDGMIDVCYPANTAGCLPAPMGMPGYVCQGICGPGLAACTNGQPGTCTGAVTPTPELCNGLDDDCDGEVDEDFNAGEQCFSDGIGACRTEGVFVCAADGKSATCTAPIVAGSLEVCDGIDNDCDGMTDEDLGAPIGQACGGSGGCGAGVFICERGTIVCTGGGTGSAEVCDGQDNDCDGFVDESPLPNEDDPCPPAGMQLPLKGECKAGMLECVQNDMGGASMVCEGAVGPTPEICDGKDNDCDGVGDDMAACPSATDACFMGTCVQACREGEFPCGFGFRCRTLPEGRFCVPNPCDFITCPTGQTCNVDTAMCEDPCSKVTCDAPRKCFSGRCVDCFVLGCPENQFCRATSTGVGECQVDKCANVTCAGDQFCRDGTCVSLTCTPECAAGSVCVNGQCQALTCDLENCRNRTCATGQACNPTDGQCIPDPCVTTMCPTNFTCEVVCGGVSVCVEGGTTPGVPDETVKVLATGGGGMACEIGPVASHARGWTWLLAFGLIGLVLRRRKK